VSKKGNRKVKYEDMTGVARQTVELVQSIPSNKQLTAIQLMEVLRGYKSQANNKQLKNYGVAASVNKNSVERLVRRLILDGYLGEKIIANRAGFSSSYVELGIKYRDVFRNNFKFGLEYIESAGTASSSKVTKSKKKESKSKKKSGHLPREDERSCEYGMDDHGNNQTYNNNNNAYENDFNGIRTINQYASTSSFSSFKAPPTSNNSFNIITTGNSLGKDLFRMLRQLDTDLRMDNCNLGQKAAYSDADLMTMTKLKQPIERKTFQEATNTGTSLVCTILAYLCILIWVRL
jgi:superfamily II DNA helicase RecQ